MRETSAQTVTFYRDIVQNLKRWYAPAPKLHTEPAAPSDSPAAEQVILPAWASDDIPAPTIEPAS